MPKSKFFELLAKFAEPEVQQPSYNLPPPETLEDWGFDLVSKMQLVVAEMEQELSLLRRRKFDPELIQRFSQIREHLIRLFRSTNRANPFKGAHELLEFLNSKSTRNTIEDLDFLAHQHLKQPDPDPNIPYGQKIRSLKLLPKLKEIAEGVLKQQAPAAVSQTMKAVPMPGKTIAVPPIPPAPGLPSFRTPLPPTAPESPEAKRRKEEEEVG